MPERETKRDQPAHRRTHHRRVPGPGQGEVARVDERLHLVHHEPRVAPRVARAPALLPGPAGVLRGGRGVFVHPVEPGVGDADHDWRREPARADQFRGTLAGVPGLAEERGRRVEDVLPVLEIDHRVPAPRPAVARGQPHDEVAIIPQAPRIEAAVQPQGGGEFFRAGHGRGGLMAAAGAKGHNIPFATGFRSTFPRGRGRLAA